jgi:O-antigen/teichoic acid export membrane protein
MIAGVASTAAYPIFSRLYVESRSELPRQIELITSYFAAGLALAATLCICLSEPLIALLYGAGFGPSVPVLRVLAIDLVVSSLALLFHRVLGAIDRQRAYLQSISIGVCLNSLLAWLLVARFGALGAAWSTLASEVAALWLLYRHVRAAGFDVGLAGVLSRAGVGVALGVAAWEILRSLLVPPLGDGVGALTGLVVCLAALVALGVVPRADLPRLRNSLFGGGARGEGSGTGWPGAGRRQRA